MTKGLFKKNEGDSFQLTPRIESVYSKDFKALMLKYCSQEWCLLLDHFTLNKTYHINDHIFREGEDLKFIHIIDTGKVKITSFFGKDKERILRLASDHEIIGHRGLGEGFKYSASAIALTEVTLSLIPLEMFNSVLKANSQFCFQFLLFMAEELRKSEEHMKDLERMNVNQRVASALLINLDAFGYDPYEPNLLNYCLSRSDLSKIAGTTYESIVRTIGSFNDKKIIKIDNKKIYVLDKSQLRDLLKSE